ncbi:Methylmalonyl-CoA carboxyltransferase 12S subunit [compost metagenome]
MKRIESKINTSAPEYVANQAHNQQLIAEFRAKQEKVRNERPARDLDRLASQGKMFVRDRLRQLLDPGTPFLELSSLAANKAYEGEVPGAGCVTGIGIVGGREVVINAGDASVKGGAWYPLTVKKTVRALDIAIENRLPVVHLCDSAGGFLPEQADLFADKYYAGRIFRNQCQLSKLGVPQVAVVLGHCTAGGAYVPALSEYNVIVRGTGAIFLAGPPLVKAATGEDVTVEELGGCDMHTSTSGTADYPASSEEEAIAIARDIVSQFHRNEKGAGEWQTPEDPYYDPSELYGILPRDIKQQFDMLEVIARIVDGSRFHEYQPNFGKSLICGYANIWGHKVGILANNGVLFNDSALKGAHFIELCNQNKTPLVFLQNITGFMVGREYERRGITKDGAKMIMAVACSDVPKFTVMCNGSFGAGNYGMSGRAFDSRLLFSWPNSQISVMGAEQAANTLADVKVRQMARQGKTLAAEEISSIREPVLEEFRLKQSALWSTSEIWDDGIIDPVATRNALGMGIAAAQNSPMADSKFGVFRM